MKSRALVLLMLCASALAEELSPALSALFEQALQALKAGQLEAAERDLLQVIRQGGNLPVVHHNLGVVYQNRRDPARAAEQFRTALTLDPQLATSRLLLGVSLLALNQPAEAVPELENAARMAPRDALPHVYLAKAYERMGRVPAMVAQLREARALALGDPEYAYQLGRAYMKLASWSLERIKKLDPNSPRLYQALAESYRAQGNLDLAAKAFQRAIQMGPQMPDLHVALAVVYLQQGNALAAAEEIKRELAIVPENVGALALKRKIEATLKR